MALDFVRERLKIAGTWSSLDIASMNAAPIPEEPPVTITALNFCRRQPLFRVILSIADTVKPLAINLFLPRTTVLKISIL